MTRSADTDSVDRLWRGLLAARYLILAGGATLIWKLRYRLLTGDFAFFEHFGRVALHKPRYPGGWHALLHVYTEMPKMQIGPPPLLLGTPLMALNGPDSNRYSVLAMMLAIVPCLWLAERAARAWGASAARTRPCALLAGVVALPMWADAAMWYQHLDDILIVGLVGGAIWAAGRDRWLLAATLLGTAAASKPWAIAIAPLLLAAPRTRRAPAALTCILVLIGWWAPFLVADSHTFAALGSAMVPVHPGSVYALFGVHGKAGTHLCQNDGHCLLAAYHWMRSLQLALCFVAAAVAVHRRRVLAAPLVGLTVRVLLDSQTWPYYGLGPVMMALVWDLARGRRVPTWALFVGAWNYSSVVIGSPTAQATIRLLGALVVLGWFLRPEGAAPGDGVALPAPREAFEDVASPTPQLA